MISLMLIISLRMSALDGPSNTQCESPHSNPVMQLTKY